MLIDAPWPQTVVAYAVCLFLYSVVWTYSIKTFHRCLLELNTGFLIILAAYENWLYLVVFIIYTVGDIFVQNPTFHRAAAYGLLYFYTHTSVLLAGGQVPYLCVVPLILIAGRLYRIQPEKKASYNVYDIRLPPNVFAYLV